MVGDGVIGTGLVVVRIVALGTDWDLVQGEGLDTRLDGVWGVVCWSKNAQKEERLADPGSRGEDSDGVEGEDESESEKRRGLPSLRERLPMSAGLGVGELRARLGVWFDSVVVLDGAGVVSISVGRDMVTLVFVSLIVW
ncbi:hypothetical protein LOTGIDRAFT_174361 [Lottia gigantea]|uniref:Uncharacterized protein n=1 Tax=Lottia gigantea TaxID=225164 RepID=V4C8M9_LOTGI|nr:hypothetical protein LOTGIDRAFT_174361 [Lottia gigantea]ESO98104.1 hypothetical protein LOTGIDRAFT_174361 [Lottia gigantea]